MRLIFAVRGGAQTDVRFFFQINMFFKRDVCQHFAALKAGKRHYSPNKVCFMGFWRLVVLVAEAQTELGSAAAKKLILAGVL